MKKWMARFAVMVLVVAAGLGVTACGGEDDASSAESDAITVARSSQPESLDPAISYTVDDWQYTWLVYKPLLTYERAEGEQGATLIPGLATDLPRISEDGKTYELTLREGLSYADGTPVKASDFEHTIKRVLNLESGGSSYFTGIVGAEKYMEDAKADADIPGIETDDASGEITIELEAPDATFSNALALTFAGVVPGDTPFEDMTKDPPPGTGPYTLTKSVPNREYVMEANPEFDASEFDGIPAAKIATITTKIVPNVSRQTEDVIANELDYMQAQPAADLKGEVVERFGPDSDEQRFKEFETLSTNFFFLNSEVAPFDERKAREAVNVGIDKPALARLYAGGLGPGCSFLPPGMPGYTEELDISECPWGDPDEAPDLERAKKLLAESGAEGAEVTVWGYSDEPAGKVAQAFADQLNQIGFDATPKIVDGGVYFQTVGNVKTGAQTGIASWMADFPHPLGFTPLIDGATLEPTNNTNLGRTDDAEINEELAALGAEPDLSTVTDRWEDVNAAIVENAYTATFGHGILSTFVSDRIDFENCTMVHPVFGPDFSDFCLK